MRDTLRDIYKAAEPYVRQHNAPFTYGTLKDLPLVRTDGKSRVAPVIQIIVAYYIREMHRSTLRGKNISGKRIKRYIARTPALRNKTKHPDTGEWVKPEQVLELYDWEATFLLWDILAGTKACSS